MVSTMRLQRCFFICGFRSTGSRCRRRGARGGELINGVGPRTMFTSFIGREGFRFGVFYGVFLYSGVPGVGTYHGRRGPQGGQRVIY